MSSLGGKRGGGGLGGHVLHQNKPSGSHSFSEIIRNITESAHEYINGVGSKLQVDSFWREPSGLLKVFQATWFFFVLLMLLLHSGGQKKGSEGNNFSFTA